MEPDTRSAVLGHSAARPRLPLRKEASALVLPDAHGYVSQPIDMSNSDPPAPCRGRGPQPHRRRATVLAVGRAQLWANPRGADSRSAEEGHRARNWVRYGGACHLLRQGAAQACLVAEQSRCGLARQHRGVDRDRRARQCACAGRHRRPTSGMGRRGRRAVWRDGLPEYGPHRTLGGGARAPCGRGAPLETGRGPLLLRALHVGPDTHGGVQRRLARPAAQ
jgi:hypothetical protein